MNITPGSTEYKTTIVKTFTLSDVTDDDVLTKKYARIRFYPEWVIVTYVQKRPGGVFRAEKFTVGGPRATKAGRSENSTVTSDYYDFHRDVPEWLRRLAEEHMPEGGGGS